MKHMKKLASLLLALVMVFSMAININVAAADKNGSIKITNPADDTTYNAYLMFELESYNKDTKAYSYKITDAWKNFVETGYGKDYFAVDNQGYVTVKEGAAIDAPALAKAAVAYAKANNVPVAATLTKDAPEATGLTLGYYVVDSSMGAICDLTTTQPSADITEKNDKPDIDKEVQEDSTKAWGKENSAQIGQKVDYKTTVSAKPGAVNYVVEDKMTKGLTFNNDVAIEGLTKGTDYTVETWILTDEEKAGKFETGFKIKFTQTYLDTITAAKDIVITYSATLNKDAVIADLTNDNDTRLTYGEENKNHSEWKETKTKTFTFDLVKTDSDNKLLDGAKFELYDVKTGGEAIKLVKVNDTTYRLATLEDTNTITEIEVKGGKVQVQGLDADSQTKYYLEETKVPAGYNKLSERAEADMTGGTSLTATVADNAWTAGGVHVINKKGTELPSTGGMGTTIFYVLGAILVVAAGVLLVTRRRMQNR